MSTEKPKTIDEALDQVQRALDALKRALAATRARDESALAPYSLKEMLQTHSSGTLSGLARDAGISNAAVSKFVTGGHAKFPDPLARKLSRALSIDAARKGREAVVSVDILRRSWKLSLFE